MDQCTSVIQHWDLTKGRCCKEDLKQAEFEELEKAVLYGDAMDAQILGIIKRFPKNFHIGMIPDMRTNFAKADVDTDAQAQIEAEHAKWQAELCLFKGNLILDQNSSIRWSSAPVHSMTSWNGMMLSKFGSKA